MSGLIDRNVLKANMYQEAFESDTDMQKWDSGCWIRYKLFEKVVDSTPTVPYGPRWHRVEEELPEPLVRCLIWDGYEVDVAYFVRGFYNSKTDWYWRKAGINRKGGKIPHREVKMWMPIEPPKEDA